MARAIETWAPVKFKKPITFQPLPPPPAQYEIAHPERVSRFLPVDGGVTINSMHQEQGLHKHLLRHDAESIIWVFLYWAFLSQPAALPGPKMSQGLWGIINGLPSERDMFLTGLSYRETDQLHDSLTPLAPLTMNLVDHVIFDHRWITDPAHQVMTRVDYVHEALQRVILAFIILHEHADFMKMPLSMVHRIPIEMTRLLSKATKRTRDGTESAVNPDDLDGVDYFESEALNAKKIKLEE